MWKSLLIVVIAVFLANGQNYSFIPKRFCLDSIPIYLPKEPGEVLDSSLTYFKQFPVDSGKICPRSGILISDRTAGEYVFYKLGYTRQLKELKITDYMMGQYYDQSVKAENLYQKEIADLEKKCQRSWYENNKAYIGFVAGLGVAILTEYVVINVSK